MITPATFRMDLPEFTDTTVYPSSGIVFWAALGALRLNPATWGQGAATAVSPPSTLYDFGLELFVAHNLVLEAQAQAAAAKGGLPGQTPGVVSSKAVGPVSVGYDTGAAITPGDSHWNLTTYGIRFREMFRMAGMGGLQINGSHGVPFGVAGAFGGAWMGPGPLFPVPGGSGFG